MLNVLFLINSGHVYSIFSVYFLHHFAWGAILFDKHILLNLEF